MPWSKKAATLAILLAQSLPCPAALAWGADGHRIIATIAWHYLTPEARAAVTELLKDDPDRTLAEASTWADRIRSDHSYDWAKPLHYVNVAEGAVSFDMRRDCSDSPCVVAAIEQFTAVLRDPSASPEKRREALKFVAHFVGDVHQPLHVSRARDKGGNDIKVEFFGNQTDLHSVWDGQILRRAKKPWRAHAEELRQSITAEQQRQWSASAPAEWATESWKLALSNAYDVPSDGQLGQIYQTRNLPVVEERLKMAGVRLAAVLNLACQGAARVGAVTPATPAEADVQFVGSRNSDVYHYPNCAVVKKIKPDNLVKYKIAPEGKRLHKGCPG